MPSSQVMEDLPSAVSDAFPAAVANALLELRRDLHRHPELSFEERETQQRLRGFLYDVAGVDEVEAVADTGLVARIPGTGSDGPVVAVRGDIDALPIREETGLEWASENEGVMHACGHDVHAAWAAGAGSLLARDPAVGDVLVVLQPGEETGRGARAVLESGALDRARAIFGAHVDRQFPVGRLVAKPGPIAASADSFRVTITGRGGHGARPSEARDPIGAAADAVSSLYAVIPRRVDADRAIAVSVTRFRAGEADNVIPDSAVFSGTIRATHPEARAAVIETLERVVTGVADSHGVEAEVEIDRTVPPVLNDERAAGWARSAAEELLGEEGVVPLPTANMAGEDFAHYLERMEGCFLRIGAREEGGEYVSAHSPRFYAADGCIFVGAAVLAGTARAASRALA